MKKYKVDNVRVRDTILPFILNICVVCCCVWLMFHSILPSAIATAVFAPFLYRRVYVNVKRRRAKKLEIQFTAALTAMSSSLAAGMTLGRCIAEIAEDRNTDYSVLRSEFERMCKLMRLNWTAEKAFESFAARCDNHDIRMFAVALSNAMPTGANLVELVRSIASSLRLKCDTEAEIDKTLNLPRYNNRIIIIMPFAMLALLQVISPEYIEPLYSGVGSIVSAAVAGLFAVSFVLSDLLGNIKY